MSLMSVATRIADLGRRGELDRDWQVRRGGLQVFDQPDGTEIDYVTLGTADDFTFSADTNFQCRLGRCTSPRASFH